MSEDEPIEKDHGLRESRMLVKAWAIGAGLLIVGLFAGFSIASETVPPAPLPETEQSLGKPTHRSIPGSGTFLVGSDVGAGLYHSYGNADCKWSRSKDATGERQSVIANDSSIGDAYVHLQAGEFFSTTGCTTWQKVSDRN
ncbi:hypothetical protein ABZS76_32745 [Streptomyces sp. NPDC005562]|uniref:hypothetical protein n=1 Tax=Streptomyces sp. NPDC005562 TaxID=3154890 RepID=UPI0033AAD0D0